MPSAEAEDIRPKKNESEASEAINSPDEIEKAAYFAGEITGVRKEFIMGMLVVEGGAMGIPQFMPDTWLEYKDRISEIVGKDNPDPWNPKDGAIAMALKLSDVYGVTDHNLYAERNAAKLYLSGTTLWQYDWCANQIIYWSKNYKKIIG